MDKLFITYSFFIFMLFTSCIKNPDKKSENSVIQKKETTNIINDNPVAKFLRDPDIQYETEQQGESIKIALNDALALNSDSLKNCKYNDYAGRKNSWDLKTLIESYFVSVPISSLGGNFYNDVKKPASQEEIKKILTKIKNW